MLQYNKKPMFMKNILIKNNQTLFIDVNSLTITMYIGREAVKNLISKNNYYMEFFYTGTHTSIKMLTSNHAVEQVQI